MSGSKTITPYDGFDEEPAWADEEFDFRTTPGTWSDQSEASDLVGIPAFFGAMCAFQLAGYGGLGPQIMAFLVYAVCATLWARLRYWAVHRVSGNPHVISFAKSYRTFEWRRRSFRWDDIVGVEVVTTRTFPGKKKQDFADIAILTKDKRTLVCMQLLLSEAEDLVAVLQQMSQHAKMGRASRGGYRGVRVSEAAEELEVEVPADGKERIR